MEINMDLIWTLVGLALTLCVFSYLFGDNSVFRFATALLIGVSAGYFAVVIIFQVLLPKLVVPLVQGETVALVPLFLSGLLLTKLSPKMARYGNLSMAVLVGAGAAIAIGGAALGTIFSQTKGAVAAFAPQANHDSGLALLEGVFMILGTISVLAYFNFGARETSTGSLRRTWPSVVLSGIGQLFIALTLGAVFAGVLSAAITALVERTGFVIQAISGFLL